MLLALLLMRCAAAEWVEISQQHYRKPVRITTLDTTRTHPDVQNPTRDTYQDVLQNSMTNTYQDVLQTPIKDTFHSPVRKYQEDDHQKHSAKNFSDYEVLMKPMIENVHDETFPKPPRYFDQDIKPVRLNPFLQDISSQSPIRITKIDSVSDQNTDSYLNKKLETTIEEAYLNRSIAENNWNQNIYNGNPSFDNWNKNTHNIDERNKLKVENNVPNTVRNKNEMVSGKIERVPNIGSVKRVQLANTPVKTPVLNNKMSGNENRRSNNHGAHNYDNVSDELDLETKIFNTHLESVSKKTSNNVKQEPVRTEKVEISDMNRDIPKRPLKSFQRNPFTHDLEDNTDKITKVIEGNVKLSKNGISKNIESSAEQRVVNKVVVPNKDEPLEEFNANEAVLPVIKNDTINSHKEFKPNIEDQSRKKYRGSVKIEKVQSAKQEASSENNENINSSTSDVKVNTLEKILKFMKVVADTISKNTRKGTHGKIKYLNELKYSLLASIKDRIDATWPDDETGVSRRHSRSASPRGHVEFPSSESALMTISFLTFAVFLIKLVLQVIQTYKHKTMLMAPLMVATAGRTVSKKLRENLN